VTMVLPLTAQVRVGRLASMTILASILTAVSTLSPQHARTRFTSLHVTRAPRPTCSEYQNVLILDHLNINHEKGRHDWLCAFYVDILGCTLDPRKLENLDAGKGTLWANAGIHQFHLPEGKPSPQVFDGVITMAYGSLAALRKRLKDPPAVLAHSKFDVLDSVVSGASDTISMVDPWGTRFDAVQLEEPSDPRGSQPGAERSEARAIVDLTVHVRHDAALHGIARFYEHVLGMPALSCDEGRRLVLGAGGKRTNGSPRQTLTFLCTDRNDVSHDEVTADADGMPINNGAHISLYLHDLAGAYRRANALGLCYVNHRFKRRAFNEEEALDQCMFRVLDVVDPRDPAAGPILRLEHEVRSATKADGSKYKSCPLDGVDVSSATA